MEIKTQNEICREWYNNKKDDDVKWVRVNDVDIFIDCFCKNYKMHWDNGNPLSPNEIKSILTMWKNINLG